MPEDYFKLFLEVDYFENRTGGCMKTKIRFSGYKYKRDYNRIFVVSDIHNRYDCYKQMRESLRWGKNDLVIVDGDFVDRGGAFAEPAKLIRELYYHEERDYDVIVIKGNHEVWLSRDLKDFLMEMLMRLKPIRFFLSWSI